MTDTDPRHFRSWDGARLPALKREVGDRWLAALSVLAILGIIGGLAVLAIVSGGGL